VDPRRVATSHGCDGHNKNEYGYPGCETRATEKPDACEGEDDPQPDPGAESDPVFEGEIRTVPRAERACTKSDRETKLETQQADRPPGSAVRDAMTTFARDVDSAPVLCRPPRAIRP
jgi:hypothetical protein